MVSPQDILEYWFGPMSADDYPADNGEIWWKKNPDLDAEIKDRFGAALAASARGELDHWRKDKAARLAHIILVDQMSRNMHRDSADMYAQDDLAQELSLLCAISDDFYGGYYERMFQHMPLMHAENLALQRLCEHLFEREVAMSDGDVRKAAANNLDYATKHRVIIERFGRFPHRNKILGRESTAEEIEFLKQPGSSF